MEYQNFTSLPPEQERQFVIYEQTAVEARKKAMTLGAIIGGCVGIFALVLFFSYDAPINAHAVEMPSELEEEVAPAPAAAPAPAPVETPDEPAAEEAAEGEAPAEAAATEAPEPPKGATKAPPTALIGQ